jgi:cell wall integrity and stress response component
MRSNTALIAAGMLAAASTVVAQEFGVDVTKGCYSAVNEYVFNTTYIYNTDGYCQKRCAPLGYNAMATTKGTDCWCGQTIPDPSAKVDDALCSTKCAGFGDKTCKCLLCRVSIGNQNKVVELTYPRRWC